MNRTISLAAVLIVAGTACTKVIDGFDGFKWGASRTEIVEVRGAPNNVYDTIAVWSAPAGESIGDHGIKTVFYYFREGCSELKESISQPCKLSAGSYVLATTSEADFEALTRTLGDKYGSYAESSETDDRKDYRTEELLAKITTTRRKWKAPDKSSVEVTKRSYDRDFSDSLLRQNYHQGIFAIGVTYTSAYANEAGEKKVGIKTKSF